MITRYERSHRAISHLAATGSEMRDLIAAIGACELSPAWQRSPFESLVRAVSHQQLQGKAAEAILGRFLALFAPRFRPGRYPGSRRSGSAGRRILTEQDPGDPRHRGEGGGRVSCRPARKRRR